MPQFSEAYRILVIGDGAQGEAAQVLLTVDSRFRRGLNVQQLESAIDRIESRIRQQEPSIERIFIEADSLRGSARKSSQAA